MDLTTTLERDINLVGRGIIRCRYAAVTLRITDGRAEAYEWEATVAFAPFRVLRCLLGFAGFLQFFDHSHRTPDLEVIILHNRNCPGRRI